MCLLARTTAGGENPRGTYEASAKMMTLDSRQRQLHDEDKSCGIQPAYIRVIYRRLSAAVLTQVHYSKGGYKKNQI
jgi:hypothetical protein